MKSKQLIIYPIICMILAFASLHLNGQTTGVNLKPRAYLQGALHGLLPAATLMRDDLRAKGLIPAEEPYSSITNNLSNNVPIFIVNGGGESTVGPAVLQTTGNNAIVDWVIVELRSVTAIDSVIWGRAVLVQRDGDVVDVDGVSPVNFPNASPGLYRVAIRHRNHLGVMSGEDLDLGETPVSVDFTNPDFPTNCTNSMITIGNKRALWAGDLNHDGRVIYQGPGNDIFKLFSTVLYDSANTAANPTFVSKGYLQADGNMDGRAIYQGAGNDRTLVIQAFLLFFNFYSQVPEMPVMLECIP